MEEAHAIEFTMRIYFRHRSWTPLLPLDGSERFLVDEAMLMSTTARLGATLLDPLKTSVVQNLRSMATWVIRKD
jgi:hypothetical protein